MESKQEIRNSLGIAYGDLEAHIELAHERNQKIDELNAEKQSDRNAIEEIRKKLDELLSLL